MCRYFKYCRYIASSLHLLLQHLALLVQADHPGLVTVLDTVLVVLVLHTVLNCVLHCVDCSEAAAPGVEAG